MPSPYLGLQQLAEPVQLQQGKRDEARSMFHGIQSDIIFGQRTRQLLDTL
jgi:hypothetical protein